MMNKIGNETRRNLWVEREVEFLQEHIRLVSYLKQSFCSQSHQQVKSTKEGKQKAEIESKMFFSFLSWWEKRNMKTKQVSRKHSSPAQLLLSPICLHTFHNSHFFTVSNEKNRFFLTISACDLNVILFCFFGEAWCPRGCVGSSSLFWKLLKSQNQLQPSLSSALMNCFISVSSAASLTASRVAAGHVQGF